MLNSGSSLAGRDRGTTSMSGVFHRGLRAWSGQCLRPSQAVCRQTRVRCMRDDASDRFRESTSDSVVPDSLPVAAPGSDWRAFRARLIASHKAEARTTPFAPTPTSPVGEPSAGADLPEQWAHELPWPERGCVLVAHPSLFIDRQTYFQQAVILLLDHGPSGSYGVILNRPTNYTLGQIRSSVAQLLANFSSNRLYMGGDVGDTAMAVVTTRGDVVGAAEVTRGLHHTTVHAAQQAVEQGVADPQDFRFFAQYAGWAPGQLAKECAAGVWFCAAASPSLVMDEGISQGKELWHRVLETMGGDHARVSQIVREVERRETHRRQPARPQQQQQQAAAGSAGASSSSSSSSSSTATTATPAAAGSSNGNGSSSSNGTAAAGQSVATSSSAVPTRQPAAAAPPSAAAAGVPGASSSSSGASAAVAAATDGAGPGNATTSPTSSSSSTATGAGAVSFDRATTSSSSSAGGSTSADAVASNGNREAGSGQPPSSSSSNGVGPSSADGSAPQGSQLPPTAG